MENKKIIIIDETLREGMQYQGLMFSLAQRLKILEFQERLKVDICQAGYPPAHDSEAGIVKALCHHARKNKYGIRIAAMGRANIHDAAILLATHVNDLHFHLHIKNDVAKDKLDQTLQDLSKTIDFIRREKPGAYLSIAMLDIGKTDTLLLEKCILFLCGLDIDILSLPDTSGIMAPNHVHEKIKVLAPLAGHSSLSIHCHNDMGMASANSVMGIISGGRVLEASVLGIGERNGIADLYTTVKTLQDQGFDINLKTDDILTFKAYYEYVDSIVYEQTRNHLLTANTPVFGNAVKTHVAGTHAKGDFGLISEEKFYLNLLCGRRLVQKYLDLHHIRYDQKRLEEITLKIKAQSFTLGRRPTKEEVGIIAASFT